MTTTPWGTAERKTVARVDQRAGERRFSTLVEVLETGSGERLVRIAYATDGSVRRGPVTLRARDLARLRTAVLKDPLLREALLGDGGFSGPGPGGGADAEAGAETPVGRASRRVSR
jgi:hypothetical protein